MHASDDGAGAEDAGALGQLVLAVPRADDVLHARVEGALSEADQEAEGVDLLDFGALGHDDGEDGPGDFAGGDPYRGTDPGQE